MPHSTLFTVDQIAVGLQGGNGTMAKRYLEAHGLPRGAGDSVDELAQRIANYESEEKLSHADVERLLREMLEYGDKRVHLFRGNAAAMRAVGPRGFAGKAVDSLEGVRVARRPREPTLNYALVTPERIRLSYSETHVFRQASYATETFTRTSDTRLIVIDANLRSGIVAIAFDSPGEHPHGRTASDYFEYYSEIEAPGLLNTQLVPLEYFGLLQNVEKEEHRHLVRPGVVRGLDRAGLGLRYTGQGTADLRDYETFRDARGRIALRKSGRLIWKKTDPRPNDLSVVRAGNALLRDIATEVLAAPAVVRFAKHTLSHEMAYVLQTIRGLA